MDFQLNTQRWASKKDGKPTRQPLLTRKSTERPKPRPNENTRLNAKLQNAERPNEEPQGLPQVSMLWLRKEHENSEPRKTL